MKESKYPKIGNVNCERSLPTQSLLNISASTFSFLLRTISFIYIVSHTFQCAIILCFHESALLTLRINSPFKNTTLTTKINKCFVIHYYKEKYSKYCCCFSRIQRLFQNFSWDPRTKMFQGLSPGRDLKNFWIPRNFPRIPGRWQ